MSREIKNPNTPDRMPSWVRETDRTPTPHPSHRILSFAERRELFRRLPPTPLPHELRTPTTMIGAPYPPYQKQSTAPDSPENVPLHRRLFAAGTHQYTPNPKENDYFSIPPSEYDYQSKMTLGNIRLRCDEANKQAAEEMQRRKDEAKYGLRRCKEGRTMLDDSADYETSWLKVVWNGIYVGRVLVLSVALVISVKRMLPLMLLALLVWVGMGLGMAIKVRYMGAIKGAEKNPEFEDVLRAVESKFDKPTINHATSDSIGYFERWGRPSPSRIPLSKFRDSKERLRLDRYGRVQKTRNNRDRSRSLKALREENSDGTLQVTRRQAPVNGGASKVPSPGRE